MTPPDSDERFAVDPNGCARCGRPEGQHTTSPEKWCDYRDVPGDIPGQWTPRNRKPDSDAREVCGAMVARVNGGPLICEMARGHDGAHEAKLARALSATGPVLLSLDLARRILAALELTHEAHCVSLAAELREVLK